MWNSLHETNGKYENLNSMKSQLQYNIWKAAVAWLIVFMNTSQQQIHTCKSHNMKQIWNTKTLQ